MANLAIDTSKIESMLSQIRAAGARASGGVGGIGEAAAVKETGQTSKTGFADALKASLDSVNASQQQADQLGKSFASGDDSVNLSDVMISMQKANINFQATVQVRNRLVSAYHDIMNMQI